MNATIDHTMKLYPDIASLGSPFGIGNETFGLSSAWKTAAASSRDVSFAVIRRVWTQVASGYGVRTYA